jgi:hypothetical protein
LRKLYILLFILYSFVSSAQTEYRKYAIKAVGIKVGELFATKSQTKGQETKYTLSSKVDVNFLVYHLLVDYRVTSKFRGDMMSFSEVNVKSNRGDFNTKTLKTQECYKLTSHQPKKEIEKSIKASILSTFSSIHFHEPENVAQVYAEFYGDFIKIKPLGNHKYSGVLADNVDEYYYKNGSLLKAIKKNPITDMVIVLEKTWVE